jgi:hypothetical protein
MITALLAGDPPHMGRAVLAFGCLLLAVAVLCVACGLLLAEIIIRRWL